jgi:uncharacterized protein YfaS (alpha-2-macroglobulin family)
VKKWLSGRPVAVFFGLLLFVVLMAVGIRDEVPLAGITGDAFMAENSSRLAGAFVTLRPKFEIPDWHASAKTFKTDQDGRFHFSNIPAGPYTIEAYSKQHSMRETAVVLEEGKTLDVNLELKPNDPYLRLNAGQHVFTPNESPSFNIEGFGFDDKIALRVYTINYSSLLNRGGLQQVLSASYRWDTGLDLKNSAVFIPGAILEHEISRRDVEGAYTEDVRLQALPKGIYWIEASSSNRRSGTWLQVSDIALIAKKAGSELVCFVTDIQTGQPIPGASLTIHQGGKTWPVGASDGQGLARVSFANATEDGACAIVAERGDSRALVSFWSHQDDAPSRINTFIYTDRPVYRPGHQVSYKGVVRQLVGNDYQIPAAVSVRIEVKDPDENVIETQTIATSSMGTFSGSFSLNSESPTGTYAITCHIGSEESTKYVQVASYRKPEYTVTVSGEKPYFVRGDRARAVVSAQYYFGGPVVGAKVQAWIYRSPEWNSYLPFDEPHDEEEDYESAGEFVQQVEAETDAQGRAIIEFETLNKSADPDSDYIYTVTASVEDSGGKYYDGTGKVRVTRGEFNLNLDTADYILSPGGATVVTAIATEHGTKRPVRDVVLRMDYGYESWTGNQVQVSRMGTQTVRTDAAGKALLNLLVQGPGPMRIVAIAKDSRGNEIRATQYLYVTDVGDYDYGAKTGSVEVILDKKEYKVGDNAKALIMAKGVTSAALVTVEGDGVYSRQVVQLRGGSAKFNLSVLPEYAPNCYVSVALISGKKFYEGSKRLSVDLSQKLLNISIESDKRIYEPGGAVTYTIKTTDTTGRAVPAEVSFGVVDESIYAIREDTQDIVKAFYPKRTRSVETLYSFPEIYLGDADKDAATMPVREKFLDTAFWAPVVVTGTNGIAVVRVSLPDNLTTWRATATGVTDDTRVGRATQKIVVQKPLMIRLQSPRFFTQKDISTVSAIVHNNTGSQQEVTVTLDAPGLAVEGGTSQTIRVAQEPRSVEWRVAAPKAGNAIITVSAKAASGVGDAMRLTVPIKAYGQLMVNSKTGDVRTSPDLRVTVHQGYVEGSGTLRINLSPSVSGTLLNSVDYLVGYPYGCTEQTMSRFMPTVVVASTLRELGMAKPDLEAKIPDMIAKGYARLRKYQHGDGGWGWWEYDTSEAWMTAYVLEGYSRAAAAGYPANQVSLERAISWGKNHLIDVNKSKGFALPEAEDLRLLSSLAANGSTQFAATLAAAVDLKRVYSPKQLIPLLHLYHALGAPFAEQMKIALKRLEQMAEAGPSRASWKEEWYGVETTAQAALAIATVDPKNPILPRVVRWLVLQQRGDHWFSTRDTAYALLALTQYMRAVGESRPDFSLDVLINGEVYTTMRITPDKITGGGTKLDIPFAKLKVGDNQITFRLTGEGNCYYSAEVRQTVDRGSLAQSLTGEDLRVDRKYFRLETRRLEDGTLRLMPSVRAVDSVEAGDLVRCVLTIESGKPREFLMLEVPLPSGFEVSDREDPAEGWDWENWWSKTDIRDDRILFFARRLKDGTSTISYTMRAETPGRVRALPATLSNMYDPDVRASSGDSPVEVRK